MRDASAGSGGGWVGKIREATTQAGRGQGTLASFIAGVARAVFLSEPAQVANDVVDRWCQARALRAWEANGRALPPPHAVKRSTVRAYARAFGLDTLIETGTYLGAMIKSTRDIFRTIISIELDPHLYERARHKLSEPGHITILNGDSAEVLPRILAGIRSPCLFWLDAHHSGMLTACGKLESPVSLELECILSHPVGEHVVLIDDAHAFVGRGGYPTLDELQAMVATYRPAWLMDVADDIIRLHRRRGDAPRR